MQPEERVFLSYARAGGAEFAAGLRTRLAWASGLPVRACYSADVDTVDELITMLARHLPDALPAVVAVGGWVHPEWRDVHRLLVR